MLPQSRSYEELYRQFRWQVPVQFNIGVEVCDRWAERDPGRPNWIETTGVNRGTIYVRYILPEEEPTALSIELITL